MGIKLGLVLMLVTDEGGEICTNLSLVPDFLKMKIRVYDEIKQNFSAVIETITSALR